MLQRLLRWLLYGFGAVCALVILGVFLLWWFFPAEQVRQYVVATMERRLQRPISLGAIRLQGLGLVLSELRIADDDPQAPPLLSVNNIRARLSLRHIFSGRLTIAQMAISQPHLSLVERHGRWNLLKLLATLQQTAPAPEPESPRPLPTATEGPPLLPIGLELSEFLMQDIVLHLRRDNDLDLRLDGLSLRLTGEISRHTNQLTARFTAAPTRPNFALRLEAPEPLQAQALLFVDVQVTQQHFRSARLSGTVKLTARDLRWRDHTLPVELRSSTSATLDLAAQTLEIHHLHVHFGSASELKLQGQVRQIQTTPRLDLTLTQSRIHTADLQGFLATLLPDLTLEGTFSVPYFTVQGPATDVTQPPWRLDGSLAVEGLNINAPGLGLHLTKLDGTLTDLHSTLIGYQPQELSGSLELQLHQADVAPLSLRSVRAATAFSLHGAQPGSSRLDATVQVREIHYQHPTLGPVTTTLDSAFTAAGDFQAGNLSTLQLTARVGSWLETSVSGTLHRFGQDNLELTQETTLHLEPLHAALPALLLKQLGTIEARGVLHSNMHLRGSIATAESGSLTMQAQIEVNTPWLRYDSLGTLKGLQGTLNLQTAYTLPDRPQTLAIHGHLAIQEALAAEQIALRGGDVAFRLRLPEGSKQHGASYPELELELRSDSFQQRQFAATFQDVTGRMKAQTAAISLIDVATTPLLSLLRQPRAEGSISWSSSRITDLATDRGTLAFQAASDTMQWQRSQTHFRLQARKVQYGSDTKRASIPTLSLHLRTSQDLDRGFIKVEQLRFDAPDLLRLRAQGNVTEWGKTFNLTLHMPESHLAPLLAQVPPPYGHPLSSFQIQGQIDMSLAARGKLPSLEDLLAQRLPQLDLQLRLRDMDFISSAQPVNIQNAQGTLHIKSTSKHITLRGEIGVSRLLLSDPEAEAPLAIKLIIDSSFREGDQLHIRTSEVRFPTHGIILTQQGRIKGFADLLSRKAPFEPSTLLETLSGQLTTSLSIATPARLQSLLPGLDIQGSLQHKSKLTLRRGTAVHTKGHWQIDNLTVTYAPYVQLSGLEGTIQYRKVLTLNRSPGKAPSGRARPTQDSPPGSSVPRALRGQLRSYSSRRDSLVLEHLTLGPLTLSDIGFDVIFKDQAIEVEHFQANVLDGAIAGSLQLGRLAEPSRGSGVHLSSEFAQVNLARLLPEGAGIEPGAGNINGNLNLRVVFPSTPNAPMSLNALTMTVNITHIGEQALDRFLLFLDPLEKNPTIANQRRLLRLATPRLVTIRLRNGVLNLNTELDTPLGRKNQPLSPIPISALEEAGFSQVNPLIEQLEPIRALIQLITAQGIRVDKNGQLSVY